MADTWKWTPESKLCFVTTGATAPFTALIESILSPSSLDALRQGGFTHLLVQYGSARDVYTKCSADARAHLQSSQEQRVLIVDGIDFSPDGLQAQFQLVQRSKGLVISHAGSGSILEALRYQTPLVVVPNTGLLDNHQEELAVAMERNNYLIRGDVTNLAPAIRRSDEFRVKMSQFPPITSGKHRETKRFAAIMDETTGFMD
ncbi:glycosyltransferase family 1 protein [Bipolaris maydis ATCC 48331]|uniref:UDP-N-acetylglucosamine transferase subunit ALG13 n=2 Tax=Cochliobolus heterostrophus TaxID=5016 RepID=M2U4D4_COCH5|nr:glycosyltransferase family 1 protein [Bipolaris maydis ATCC 48331]EMD93409.1 glycosyltransferase family 1 protein [Bipolaris maydis C5]KAJ5027728.1 glycosyltransferase [Bipolaris maydis]ENI07143.1 glycosyltransferase family 1 protein [Bipolaris maydis ATCC 48331]KAJ6198759.1 glycosyltransferase family 28 C-terminal domain-containing protein [Bipolaris maydis]KAJ6204658.1 glycosyltransferase family 1 protein [Bipolaris maydis]